MRITNTHYFFWKHEFGQWTKRVMTDQEGTNFNCAEQYMMYQKAKLFGDDIIAELILDEPLPNKQQDLGRKVSNFNKEIWNKWKFSIVLSGNILKFTQHPDLKHHLISTHPKVLVESSPCDIIWGVGLAADDDRILDEKNWKGQNLLGQVLMTVRELLIKDSKNENYQGILTPPPSES